MNNDDEGWLETNALFDNYFGQQSRFSNKKIVFYFLFLKTENDMFFRDFFF